ncbi:tetratricopeptide repeat protein [Candidatus Chloroploca sp. Khr17]|uniref:ATP-binding protein n=1 Tax=Candidatus Chloroploca sp. Khr17 TaxID=2496869 RepID=UPI00101D9E06|nr:tetratricopeptide repeat protein [Candidatus Chloroploca sp. Khr17]
MVRSPVFGEWVRRRRIALGLTQAALADQIACSLSLVRKIERGERTLPPAMLPQVLDLLQATPAEQAAFLPESTVPLPASRAVVINPPRSRPPGAIPAPPNPLLGREALLAAIQRHLLRDGTRLLTLLGPPGVGKTRLAQHAALNVRPLFDDHVVYLALASLSEPAQLLPALARALALTEQPGTSLLNQLADRLYHQSTLLILDNFEHLLASAHDVAELLALCPQLQVIATSRAPLRLRAERLLAVEPLGLPATDQAEAIVQAPSVQLFAERAGAVCPSFKLAEAASEVATICRRLDGLPLAIELAAARCYRFSPAELVAQLSPLLSALTEGPHDLPERQRTLHSAIMWSYQLLDPTTRQIFHRLGVFEGGWTRHAAQAINGSMPIAQALPQLVEQQLVKVKDDRYEFLETLRAFAFEQLSASGELATQQARHAAFFVKLAEQAEVALDGPELQTWLVHLDAELPNLRAAYTWSLAHDGGLAGLRISTALFAYWRTRGLFSEGRRWLEPLVAHPPPGHLDLQARANYATSFLISQQSDTSCYAYLDQAIALFRACDNPTGLARSLNLAGILARIPGKYAQSVELHQQSLALARSTSDAFLLSTILNNLGMTYVAQGNYPNAITCFHDTMTYARACGNHVRIAGTLINLGNALRLQCAYTQAEATFQQGLVLAEQIGIPEIIAESQDGLGLIALASGDYPQAMQLLTQSLNAYEAQGLVFAIVRVRRNLGYLALQQGDATAAERWFRASMQNAHLSGLADIAIHAIAGLALLAAQWGNVPEAARLLGAAEHLQRFYELGTEPNDLHVRVQVRTLIASHPTWQADYAAGSIMSLAQVLAEYT